MSKVETEVEDLEGTNTGRGELVEMPPPDIKSKPRWFGGLREIWRVRKWIKNRRKLVGKGYIQWYRIDDTFPQPRYVKPELNGGGIPELELDEGRYLFPREAMIPSEHQGMWTVVHQKGIAEPMNVTEPWPGAIKTDELDEYLTQRVSFEAPSWLSNLDLDPKALLKWGVVAIIVYALLQGILSSGGLGLGGII